MENKRIQQIKEKKDEIKNSKKYKSFIRWLTVTVFALFIILSTVLSIPLVKALRTEEGMRALTHKLENYKGIAGIIVFVAVQALQVVIAVIPPVQIVGGALFGWLLGALLSFAGIVLGNLLIFLIVGRFGKPVVEAFVDEKNMKRFSFLRDEKKLTKLLMVLYIIPGVPKDVLSYIVPLTDIKRQDFFMYVMPCRLPAIVLSTVMGSNAVSGNFKVVIGLLAVSALLGILGFVLKEPVLNKLNKHRTKADSKK